MRAKATHVFLLGAIITIFSWWNFGGFSAYTLQEETWRAAYSEGIVMEMKHKNTSFMQVAIKNIAKSLSYD